MPIMNSLKTGISTLIEHKVDATVDILDNHILKATTFIGISQTMGHLFYPEYRVHIDFLAAGALVALRA